MFGVICFLFTLLIFNLCYSYYMKVSIKEEQNRYRYIALNESNYIANCLDRVISRTFTVREMIVENEGSTVFFDKMASFVYESVKKDTRINLKNIAVAPNGVISKVYPEKGNENLVGFNFLDVEKSGNKEAIDSFQSGKTVITNPFELVQGGIGIAARAPVYLENDSLWGIVTATMDFEDLLKAFNLDRFNKMNINYRLWYSNESGEKIILSENSSEIGDVVSECLSIYNLSWNLDIAPIDGWNHRKNFMFGRLLIQLICILLTLVVLFIIRIQDDGRKMRILAEQDGLTHTYSRNYLNTVVLDVKKGNWKNPKINYSLAIVDVDKFKYINDTFGHNMGDRALIEISKILKNSVSDKNDKIIRFGGDEFIMLLTEKERKAVRVKLQTVLSSVENVRFEDEPDLRLSVSVGAVSFENAREKSYSSMMKEADENLYNVKERGRGDYEIS